VQYALLIHEKPGADEGLTEQERQAISAEYLALRGEAGMFAGARLAPVATATTIRVQDSDTLVTDGPFADTKEVFAGYYLFEADDVDAAIEIARRVPAARLGGSVEVRPMEYMS
jgi:hypothetical protein